MQRMFYSYDGPINLGKILNTVLPNYKYDETFNEIIISGVDSIENATKNEITYLSNKSYLNFEPFFCSLNISAGEIVL